MANRSYKKQKNLLLLLPYIDLGGGARRIQVYCSYLKNYGWNVSVVLYSDKVKRNVETILGKDTPIYVSDDIKKILQFAKKMSIDAVYVIFDGQFNPYLEKLFLLFKKINIKVVVNNVFSYYDKTMFDLSDRVLFQTMYMGCVKFARALPPTMEIPLHKISHLTNPIHEVYLESFRLSALEREQKRRELGFSAEVCVVGRFGRPDIVKWGDELISSIFSLRDDENIAFLCVGVPRSRRYALFLMKIFSPKLKKKVLVLPPTGDDRELMSLIQICDVVGHSVNIGEGCSNAINECLFWGKPVITTLTPHCDNGQSEQVLHGITGYFAQNTHEWVKYIRTLTYDPKLRLRMGRNAHQFVIENIRGSVIAQRFARILDDVLVQNDKTSLSAKQYQSYIEKYLILMRQHTIYKPSDIWYKLLRNIRRVLNFLEHRYWNE